MSLIQFWPGASLDVDVGSLCASAVSVKGKAYKNPCRLLEIYGNKEAESFSAASHPVAASFPDSPAKSRFLPRIPGVRLEIGKGIYHPPFIWEDCHPIAIANSLLYTTNAIYRIVSNLAESGSVPLQHVDNLVDQACQLITRVYQANEHSMIKGINNNLNMFLVSKVVETLVGRAVYDAERQEVERTDQALRLAIAMAEEHATLSPRQQMALALGKGIAFVERHAHAASLDRETVERFSEVCYGYAEKGLAIDDRDRLLAMVANADQNGAAIAMCAILDDTAETVDDLLWMQQLMALHPGFHVTLLVNTAQISINFASHMLDVVLRSRLFAGLAARIGTQLMVVETYCPLISFQNNVLDFAARRAITSADFVYVKGMNFFETCQLREQDVFHAFVVYGPVSRTYTGLPDLSGVFAFVPSGTVGYRHSADSHGVRTLTAVCRRHRRAGS